MIVNGETVTEIGTRVEPGDVVWFDGEPVEPEPLEYHLLNKPAGILSAASDARGVRTVVEYVPSQVRLFPIGRLDRDTTGLIILTNDGALAHSLMHPRFEVDKVYRAHVLGEVTEEELDRLRQGVELEDGKTWPAEVQMTGTGMTGSGKKSGIDASAAGRKGVAGSGVAMSTVELVIHEGRKRQVRRMFDAIGHPVRGLHRKGYAMLTDRGLELGDSRPLAAKEVKALKRIAKGK